MPAVQTVDPFRLRLPAPGRLSRALMRAVVEPSLSRLLRLNDLRAMYRGMDPDQKKQDFPACALDVLGVSLRLDKAGLEAIPATGPLVVVANHPFGAVEGLALAHMLRAVRPDSRIMANYLLRMIPEMREHLIAVDPFGAPGSEAKNVPGLKQCLRFVRNNGCLGVFPAGEVSSLNLRCRAVLDPAWSPTVGRIIRMTRAPVLPVYFHGANGALFHLLGLVHSGMRTLLLPRQLLNRMGEEMAVSVGAAVPFQVLDRLKDDQQMVDYLRLRTYILQHRARPAAAARPGRFRFADRFARPAPAPVPVALAGDRAALAAEIESLPEDARLVENKEFLVFEAPGSRIPRLLREIGRLREVSFREVGEGTGRDMDLDRFDCHYRHLVLWHKAGREVAGAYRLGATDVILRDLGPKGLYTAGLFKFGKDFPAGLGPALELGRAFVAAAHRKGYAPLLMLWKGIAAFVAREGRYRVLFGPVSISNDYLPVSKGLMMHCLRCQAPAGREASAAVRPRHPPRLRPSRPGGLGPEAVTKLLGDMDGVAVAVADIEADGKGVPVLLRQYLKLGGQVLTFNVDRDFGSAVDGLMLVDLARTPQRILARYMGQAAAQAFLARHCG